MITKNIDINSIFPIIINIIKLNFDVVNKFAKFISPIPYIEELEVFVMVRIESLNDCSKSILSNRRMLERIKRLKKKEIKIKKEILIFSLLIFFSELKIFLFMTLFGLTSLIISIEAVFKRIYGGFYTE